MKRKQTDHPKWLDKFRGEGREIKKIDYCYYLYTFKTVYDPITKKPKKYPQVILERLPKIPG